jgi:hypothetical protein
MGINWGGALYAWNSAHVIATIVVGVVALALFIIWESYMNLKEPLVPMYIFKNGAWVAATITTGLCASVYYAFAIIWPQMVALFYSNPQKPMNAAGLSCLVGLFIAIGEIVGGFLAKRIGRLHWQCVGAITLGGLFMARKSYL